MRPMNFYFWQISSDGEKYRSSKNQWTVGTLGKEFEIKSQPPVREILHNISAAAVLISNSKKDRKSMVQTRSVRSSSLTQIRSIRSRKRLARWFSVPTVSCRKTA